MGKKKKKIVFNQVMVTAASSGCVLGEVWMEYPSVSFIAVEDLSLQEAFDRIGRLNGYFPYKVTFEPMED